MIIAYGVVNTTVNRKEIQNFNFKTTNIYRMTKEALQNCNIECEIYIDAYRSNKKRKEYLKTFIEEKHPNVIFLQSIFELGLGNDLVNMYFYCINYGIDLIIYDDDVKGNLSKYSTVNFNNEKVKDIKNIFNEQNYWNSIADELISLKRLKKQNHRGRLSKDITKDFIEAYWEYERFLIKPKEAFSRAHLSKSTFVKVATAYEQTTEYVERLLKEDKENQIGLKPKRLSNFPENFDKIIDMVDNGISLENACTQVNIPVINDIHFKRLKVAFIGGQKILREAREYNTKIGPTAN